MRHRLTVKRNDKQWVERGRQNRWEANKRDWVETGQAARCVGGTKDDTDDRQSGHERKGNKRRGAAAGATLTVGSRERGEACDGADYARDETERERLEGDVEAAALDLRDLRRAVGGGGNDRDLRKRERLCLDAKRRKGLRRQSLKFCVVVAHVFVESDRLVSVAVVEAAVVEAALAG